MANMVGADVEALRELARRFRQVAEEFETSAHRVSGVLGATRWVGRDAAMFRDTWDSRLRVELHRVAQAVSAAGDVLWANADAQEDVSSAAGGSVGIAGLIGNLPPLTLPPWGSPAPFPVDLGPDPHWGIPAPLFPSDPVLPDFGDGLPDFSGLAPKTPTPLPTPWTMPDPIQLFPAEPLPFFDDPIGSGWFEWTRPEMPFFDGPALLPEFIPDSVLLDSPVSR